MPSSGHRMALRSFYVSPGISFQGYWTRNYAGYEGVPYQAPLDLNVLDSWTNSFASLEGKLKWVKGLLIR